MKLSTKIIIGLAAATVLLSFLLPIVIGAIAKANSEDMVVECGPIKTIRIMSNSSYPRQGSRFMCKCNVTRGETNSAATRIKWPSLGSEIMLDYDAADSTLTVTANKSDLCIGKLDITLADNELRNIYLQGNESYVSFDGLELPALSVDCDNSDLLIDDCRIATLLAAVKHDPFYGGSLKIRHGASVDSLIYTVNSPSAIEINGDVGALIALPGSEKLETAAAGGDDEDDVIEVSMY